MFMQQTRPPNPYCALPCASKHHPRGLTVHFETLCSVANQSFPKLLSFLKKQVSEEYLQSWAHDRLLHQGENKKGGWGG